MSHYPLVRPWATLGAIDRDHEQGVLHEEERQQWFREHPHVVPHTAKRTDNKSQRAMADRGPSMAEGLRDIAERSAARRNRAAIDKNDAMFNKPLPPVPQQEATQPAIIVGQEGDVQGSGHEINKMSIYYVLDRSEMQGHHAETPFSQREDSQPATEAGQNEIADGPVYSTEKMRLNLLLEEFKPHVYDKTPSIQPNAFESALPPAAPFSHDHYNENASCTNGFSDFHRLDHAAPCTAPEFEVPCAQANPSDHRNGYSPTSWYEASPTGHEFSPDAQVAVAPSATPEPEIKQEYEFTEVQAPTISVPGIKEENQFADFRGQTMAELIAMVNQEYESLTNENPNSGSLSSAYRLASPNLASTDIFHADQDRARDSQVPDFVIRNAESPAFGSPGTIRESTPGVPSWWSPSPPPAPSPSPAPSHCITKYWSENEFDRESIASSESQIESEWPENEPDREIAVSPEPQFDQEWSASDMPLQESPVLYLPPRHVVPLQGGSTWHSDNPNEIDTGFIVPLEHTFVRNYSTPDSPLLDSPASPAQAPPSPERPSGLGEYSYADAPRVGIQPSHIPHDPRITKLTSRPDYMSSPTIYLRRLRENGMTLMDNVKQSLVQQQLNATNTAFTMDVPIHDVSQHQASVHMSESTNGGHSRAASFVSNESNVRNPCSNATLSRVSQSPDVSTSGGSEGSRGTKRKKRFTKTLFGKNGYLEDNEEPQEKKFKFLKGALAKGHSTIETIMGMFWDGNRALINQPKPGIVTENTATITLNTDVQSLLYAEIENMITLAANDFLMKEYYEGHLTASSLARAKRRWEKKNMPGVPEFRFDQRTQCRLVRDNRNHLSFGKASNGLSLGTVLDNWRRIAKSMSIRTFVSPDSVVKKQIHDIMDLLEILKADQAHLELIVALNAHVRGEMLKHEVMLQYRNTQNSGNSRS